MFFLAILSFFPPSLSFAPENQRLSVAANSFSLTSGNLLTSTSRNIKWVVYKKENELPLDKL